MNAIQNSTCAPNTCTSSLIINDKLVPPHGCVRIEQSLPWVTRPPVTTQLRCWIKYAKCNVSTEVGRDL